MGNVVGQTLTVASLTAPVSATAPFVDSLVTGYGNVKRNLATNQPGDFTDVKNANLEAYVLGMLSGSGAITAATITMINSSSSTNLVDSDTTRSVQVVNTNTTVNNAAGIAFRTYATNGVATLQSGVKLLAQFTARTATAVTADLAILTNNAGTISEKMRVTAAGLVGIGTSAPTHSITLPSTATGIAVYNTADQTTNLESANFSWGSNIFTIETKKAGTGTNRTLRLLGAATQRIDLGTASPFFDFNLGSNSTAATGLMRLTFTTTASSGTPSMLCIFPTVNQSGTAGYIGLLINPTETATGSGTKALLNCQVGGAARFFVGNTLATLIGLGTEAPTHPITLASGAVNGIAVYNTADQTTNYERLTIQWSSNAAVISANSSGSASGRTLRLNATSGSGGSNTNFSITRNTVPFISATVGSNTSTGNFFQLWSGDINTATSGVTTFFAIVPTINQSGSAGFTVLDLNYTETATGSGSKDFILCRKASGTTLFGVDSNGKVNMDATMIAGGTTGDQKINKPAGSVNIAAAGTTVTVTNNLVTANSIVTAVIMTNDATATLKNVVVSAGSFVINLGAAATGEVKIGRRVIN